MFDLDLYRSRINVDGTDPTLDGLTSLQQGQMGAIAFENIAAYVGGLPDLKGDQVWDKVVKDEQGGYCFELNWLFGQALEASGFTIRPFLGRVRMGMPVGGIRAHLAWIVTLGGREWIADAGFGGPGPFGPVEIKDGEQTIHGETFRFVHDPATNERVLERQKGDNWFALFGYDETPFTGADVEGANFLCATSPSEPFRDNLMMSIRRGDRHVTLMNTAFKIATPTETLSGDLSSEEHFWKLMREEFKVQYDEDTLSKVWARLSASIAQKQAAAAAA
jgi:N-hydroxyarylamine O-acetyltransferase